MYISRYQSLKITEKLGAFKIYVFHSDIVFERAVRDIKANSVLIFAGIVFKLSYSVYGGGFFFLMDSFNYV